MNSGSATAGLYQNACTLQTFCFLLWTACTVHARLAAMKSPVPNSESRAGFSSAALVNQIKVATPIGPREEWPGLRSPSILAEPAEEQAPPSFEDELSALLGPWMGGAL